MISTVTQVANLYWDLVAAYEDEQVKQNSLGFASGMLESGRKQLALRAIPALDVMKDEGEVARAEQDLTIAKSALQFQELLIKNALTKNLDDPVLEAMSVKPVDLSTVAGNGPEQAEAPTENIINDALSRRLELILSATNLKNRDISREAVNNALLPSVNLVGTYGGIGLAGPANIAGTGSAAPSSVPNDYGGSFVNTFNNSAPNYFVGLNVAIPLRNRLAKSDQYRSELETRQAEILLQQQRKQIRIEVRNAQYALQQAGARVRALLLQKDEAVYSFAEEFSGEAEAATQHSRALRWSVRRSSFRLYGVPQTLFVLSNGPGLANPDNLFVPFYTTKLQGAGIGLTLSRQIAAAHHGSVRLRNRTDTPGCLAEVTLPLLRASA